MKKKKIVAITGRRAEYGLAVTIFKAIENHPTLDLEIIVTGMHLAKECGNTIQEIRKDGFKTSHIVYAYPEKNNKSAMAVVLGKCILGLTQEINKINPDIIFVLTDLGEALVGAIVGNYMNIPVAHLHGGDVSGTVDESIRHAITKLSHIHFAATRKSAERIIKMGEETRRVYIVGAPGLDDIIKRKFSSKEEILKEFNLDVNQPKLLLVQHPVTTEAEDAGNQMKQTMEAVMQLKYQTIILYPNLDTGGRDMISILQSYNKYPFIKIYKNLSRDKYLGLMNTVDVMVGNSSSGIIEAPSFKLPVVNIGTRQQGRERSCNIIDVGYDKQQIVAGIKKALYDKHFRENLKNSKNIYGDGHAAERIVKILNKIKINRNLIQKRITY